MHKKTIKGSLTIEAAFVLPLFIFIILAMLYFIEMLSLQDKIQHGLTQSGHKMAQLAYVYDVTGIKDAKQTVYKSADNEIAEDLSAMMEAGKTFKTRVDTLSTAIGDGREAIVISPIQNENPLDWMDKINTYLLQMEAIRENIVNAIGGVLEQAETLGNTIVKLYNDKDQIGLFLKQEGVKFGTNQIGAWWVKQDLKKQMEKSNFSTNLIVGGWDGLNFGKSTFMLEEDIIDIIVMYKMKPPIDMIWIPEIPITQRVTVKAWTGYQGDNQTANKDENKEIVYITETGQVYHQQRECTYLKLSIRQVSYEVIQEERNSSERKYSLCDICKKNKKEPQATVYVTDWGDKYHLTLDCPSLKRTILEVELKQVGDKRACSKCSEKKGE